MKFEFDPTTVIQEGKRVPAERLMLKLFYYWKERDEEGTFPTLETVKKKLRSEDFTYCAGEMFYVEDGNFRYYISVEYGYKFGINDDQKEKIRWQITENTHLEVQPCASNTYVCDKQDPKITEVRIGVVLNVDGNPKEEAAAKSEFSKLNEQWLYSIKTTWLTPSNSTYTNGHLKKEYKLYGSKITGAYAVIIDYEVEKDQSGTKFPKGSQILGTIDQKTNFTIELIKPQVPDRELKCEDIVETRSSAQAMDPRELKGTINDTTNLLGSMTLASTSSLSTQPPSTGSSSSSLSMDTASDKSSIVQSDGDRNTSRKRKLSR